MSASTGQPTSPSDSPPATSLAASVTSSSPAVLPPVSAYLQAVNDGDLNGLVASFDPDGVVLDVGRSFVGRDAIRDWASREVLGGSLTVSSVLETDTVSQRLRVKFGRHGSKAQFIAIYEFQLHGQRISRLEVTYVE